jgi:protoporphyrinogen oxidase
LTCSSLLLVNILGIQTKPNPYHWLYVYDEDKYSTRVSQTHLLAPSNTPDELAGIQVEVYASKYRQFSECFDVITHKVCQEILEMNLVDEIKSVHFQHISYANIIFDHHRRKALGTVLEYLANFGLIREYDDLDPMTDWANPFPFSSQPNLVLAGRFAQWKYYWTDDCILRGQQIANVY